MNNQLTLFDRDSDYLESSVKDFDSKTASFRVHASLIYKLGESLKSVYKELHADHETGAADNK